MVLEVSWPAVRKSLRKQKVGAWQFEVAVRKAMRPVASAAISAALDEMSEDFDGFDVEAVVRTKAGYALHVQGLPALEFAESAIAHFAEALSAAGVEGRLRPLGVEYSPVRSDGPFVLTLAMQLSGEHRQPGPEEFQVFVKPPLEDEQQVDELTVKWCDLPGAEYWLTYWPRAMKADPSNRADAYRRGRPRSPHGSLHAVAPDGSYRTAHYVITGERLFSVGHLTKEVDWERAADDLEALMLQLAPWVDWAAIALVYPRQLGVSDWCGSVCSLAGRGTARTVAEDCLNHEVPFLTGSQVLGPNHPEFAAPPGWTLTEAPGGRRWLRADDREHWMSRPLDLAGLDFGRLHVPALNYPREI